MTELPVPGRSWQEVARELASETDIQKMFALMRELSETYDEQKYRVQPSSQLLDKSKKKTA
jgi:hypothetical protein